MLFDMKKLKMSVPLKVFLLDDEPIVGKRLKPALTKIGCEVEAFEDSREALARMDQMDFDIVITDIRMDEVDGIEILERVHQRLPRTRVIMITGYTMMTLARKAMEKGAFDFIAKPIKPDDLRRVVARAAETLGLAVDFKTGAGHESNAQYPGR
jgi:DNA-binding NtrC family response regulator